MGWLRVLNMRVSTPRGVADAEQLPGIIQSVVNARAPFLSAIAVGALLPVPHLVPNERLGLACIKSVLSI